MSENEPTRAEKKAFLRVLSTLAWADGVVQPEELEVLHLAANELGVALGERDLEDRPLDEVADQVTHPDLRAKLLVTLAELAQADDETAPEELSTIKYFAEVWGLPAPELPGVDWSTVVAASEFG